MADVKNKSLEYKSLSSGIVTDIDEKQGRIIGYFSKFGNIDSDGDMIMPGAYKRTLANNMRRIKHLYQHDPSMPLAGVKNSRLLLEEDSQGLKFDSTISQTSYGKDVVLLYADGVIDEHSVGFNTIQKEDKGKYNEIIEIKLWEGSTVTWGANEFAGTEAVKSLTKEQAILKMDNVLKAIRNGKYENEDVFDLLDIYFKQLQHAISDLTTTAPEQKSTLPVGIVDVMDNFIKNI